VTIFGEGENMNLSHCRKLSNRFELDACGNDGRITQEKEENRIFEKELDQNDPPKERARSKTLFWRFDALRVDDHRHFKFVFSPGLLIFSFIYKIQQRVIKFDSAGAAKESLRLVLDIYPELVACNCQVY